MYEFTILIGIFDYNRIRIETLHYSYLVEIELVTAVELFPELLTTELLLLGTLFW